MSSSISRRTLAKGAAWAAPVVAATSAVPAYAASVCPTNKDVDLAFEAQKAKVSEYMGCLSVTNPSFTIWYDSAGGANGYLSSSVMNIRNENSCTIDLASYPLAFRIDIKNLTGPDKNTSGEGYLQRSLTGTDSYGYIASIATPTAAYGNGVFDRKVWYENGVDDSDGKTVYSALWNLSRASNVKPDEDIDIQISWNDGLTSQGRITNAIRLVPLGLVAPAWGDITTYAATECSEVYSYFMSRVEAWYKNGEGCSPNITWKVATDVNATSFSDTSEYIKTSIVCGNGIWSNTSKDFSPEHDGIF